MANRSRGAMAARLNLRLMLMRFRHGKGSSVLVYLSTLLCYLAIIAAIFIALMATLKLPFFTGNQFYIFKNLVGFFVPPKK